MAAKKGKRQALLRLGFLLYCALMLWLLFDRTKPEAVEDYWGLMAQNVNLRPFETIRLYWELLTIPEYARYRNHAIVNLLGNIVMFVPLGAFLPALWKRMRKLWKTLLVTALLIAAVEIAQLLLLVGSCDVDDLILNVIGAGIGYGIYRLIKK